jgi:homoserine O-acetyltransferase
MKDGIVKMVVSPSIWGHWASGPGDSKENIKWLNEGLQELGF